DVVVDTPAEGALEGHLAAYGKPGGHHLLDLAVVHLGVPGFVAELEAVAAGGLLPALPPHLQEALVRVDEAVIEAEHVGEIGRVVEDGLVQPPLLVQGLLAFHDGATGPDVAGDVAEIAHDAPAAVGKVDGAQAPLVVLEDAAVAA